MAKMPRGWKVKFGQVRTDDDGHCFGEATLLLTRSAKARLFLRAGLPMVRQFPWRHRPKALFVVLRSAVGWPGPGTIPMDFS